MNPQTIDSTILEILASRICHDLISPVGAVNNGVEFLQEDMGAGDMSDAIGLISMSAQSAGARLQAFRLAYGAGGRDTTVKPADVHKVFEELLVSEGKIKQNWNADTLFSGIELVEGFCKLLMCTLILAQEALPKGGIVSVSRDGDVTLVTAEGTDAMLRPMVDKALIRNLDISVVEPRLVHPYVIGILAAQYGFSITATGADAGKITFRITKT
jgi:histidine phosphotransferase ChpT